MLKHRTSMVTAAAVAAALAAGGATASARPIDVNAAGSFVPAGAAAQSPAATSRTVHPAATQHVAVIAPSNSFDWGDAGIGAAGGIVLTVACVGGARTASQRRTRRGHPTTALTH